MKDGEKKGHVVGERDRTRAIRDRGLLLIDALRLVRGRVRALADVGHAPIAEHEESVDGDTTELVAPSDTSTFSSGDDALGVATLELDDEDRPESTEMALFLVADVLEWTTAVLANLNALSRDRPEKVRKQCEAEERRLLQLKSALDELLLRARSAVGQEVYRRTAAVVDARRLDVFVLHALRAERTIDELLVLPTFDDDGRTMVRLAMEHVVARWKLELDASMSSRSRRRRELPRSPLVVKLRYPDPVELGEPVTIDVVIRNDGIAPVTLAAVDVEESVVRGLDILAVTPKPTGKQDGEGATTFHFEHEIAPLESLVVTITTVARKAGNLSGEISAWTEDADAALGVVSLDVICRQ